MKEITEDSFDEMVEVIKNLPNSKILRFKKGVSFREFPEIIEDIYSKCGYRCEKSIEDYYKLGPPVFFVWEYKHLESYVYGYILTEIMMDLLLGPKNIVHQVPKGEEFKNILWMDDWDDDDYKERRKPYKALEYVDGTGSWIALLIDEATGASTVHYLDKLNETPLLVNFEQFIKLVFTSYGVVDRWFFRKKEFFDDPYLMQPDLAVLKTILPMDDFDQVIAEIRKGL